MAEVKKRRPRKPSDKQRANALEREYYKGAQQEAYPNWKKVHKEIYG